MTRSMSVRKVLILYVLQFITYTWVMSWYCFLSTARSFLSFYSLLMFQVWLHRFQRSDSLSARMNLYIDYNLHFCTCLHLTSLQVLNSYLTAWYFKTTFLYCSKNNNFCRTSTVSKHHNSVYQLWRASREESYVDFTLQIFAVASKRTQHYVQSLRVS